MPSLAELTALRRQTEMIIQENPTDVVITRRVKVSDGAGGVTYNPTPLDPQTVRFIEQVRRIEVERRTVGGETVTPDFNMLCEYNADVQKGDQLNWRGMLLEVVWVIDLDYERTCELAAR